MLRRAFPPPFLLEFRILSGTVMCMYLKFSVNFARALAADFLAAACAHVCESHFFLAARAAAAYMFNIGCFSNFSGARLSHFSRRGVHTAVCESFFLAAARESGAHLAGRYWD